MGFIKNLTFPRVLIFACLVGSCYLGWCGWNERQRIAELKLALAEGGEVEKLVREVQTQSRKFTELSRQLSTEKMGAQTNAESYIRYVGNRDNIEMGQLTITPSEKPLRSDLIDKKYKITPKDKATAFEKVRLANFLYTLESQSQRVRVTDIKIETPDRIAHHEYPPDQWTFDCTITTRQKK